MSSGLLLAVVFISFHMLWVRMDYLMIVLVELLVIGIGKLPQLLIRQIVRLGTKLVLKHLDSVGV